jgi:hypothetical protein
MDYFSIDSPLDFVKNFWAAADKCGRDVDLDAARFPAKVHELDFVTSLSLIVSDYIQFELLRGVASSLEVSSPAVRSGDEADIQTQCQDQGDTK